MPGEGFYLNIFFAFAVDILTSFSGTLVNSGGFFVVVIVCFCFGFCFWWGVFLFFFCAQAFEFPFCIKAGNDQLSPTFTTSK